MRYCNCPPIALTKGSTDDAWKLGDQLEKVADERVAVIDRVALEAAHKSGLEASMEDDRGPGPRYETGRNRDGNLPEPGAKRRPSAG